MSWASFSLLSAVMWGIAYAVYGEVLKKISITSVILYSSVLVGAFFFVVSCMNGTLSNDWEVLKKNPKTIWYLTVIFLTNVGANICFFMGMKLKNATAAGLLEMTYPLFTLVFAWLIFRESHLSLGLIIGGLLIASGILCVMYLDKAI